MRSKAGVDANVTYYICFLVCIGSVVVSQLMSSLLVE